MTHSRERVGAPTVPLRYCGVFVFLLCSLLIPSLALTQPAISPSAQSPIDRPSSSSLPALNRFNLHQDSLKGREAILARRKESQREITPQDVPPLPAQGSAVLRSSTP